MGNLLNNHPELFYDVELQEKKLQEKIKKQNKKNKKKDEQHNDTISK